MKNKVTPIRRKPRKKTRNELIQALAEIEQQRNDLASFAIALLRRSGPVRIGLSDLEDGEKHYTLHAEFPQTPDDPPRVFLKAMRRPDAPDPNKAPADIIALPGKQDGRTS